MTGITHARVVTLAESLDDNVEVDYGEWNDDHVVTGAVDFGTYTHKFDNLVESTLDAGVTIENVVLENGGITLAGDLDLGAFGTTPAINVVKWGSGTDVPFIYAPTKTDLRIVYGNPRVKGAINWVSLGCNFVNTYGGMKSQTGRVFYVRADDQMLFQTFGVAWTTALEIRDEVINVPNIPVVDPADGRSTLWSNGGVVTVGT